MATSEWLPGAFGLAGVALGGGVTAFSASRAERRRDRAEFVQTLRLARAELNTITELLENALEYGWPDGWQHVRWDASWSSYRRILAKALDYENFAPIAKPYERMVALQSGLNAPKRDLDAERRQEHPDEDPRTMPDYTFLDGLKGEAQRAIEAIERLLRARRAGHASSQPSEA